MTNATETTSESAGTSKTSSAVPSCPLEVIETYLLSMVSSTGMTLTAGIDAGIEEGALAATPTGRATATRRIAARYATSGVQRVRAFMRVTRSAKAWRCCGYVEAVTSARRDPHAVRREPAGLRFDAGGPSPLTEDRQRPRCRLDGMARNA